jgi:hypothetical protein
MKKFMIQKICKKIKVVTNFQCTLDDHDGFYDGMCINNKMHGPGKFTFDDGYIYEGIFEEGERIGRGKLYAPITEDWVVFDGYFNTDFTCDIKGKMIYRNGNIYEGSWNDGMHQGIGKMIFLNGNIYEGHFVENKMIKGKMTYKDSSIVKSITAYWINENDINHHYDVKIEFDDDLLNKLNDLRIEIQSFDVFPDILHKYIPVLGKKTKSAELAYVLRKKQNCANP